MSKKKTGGKKKNCDETCDVVREGEESGARGVWKGPEREAAKGEEGMSEESHIKGSLSHQSTKFFVSPVLFLFLTVFYF